MKEVILLKNGEIVLKGLNRNNFEDIMVKNIRPPIKNKSLNFTFTFVKLIKHTTIII